MMRGVVGWQTGTFGLITHPAVRPEDRLMRHHCGRWALVGIVAGLLMAARATAQNPKVDIVGGADESGHNYQWQVTNRYSSRIVRVEFPQFGANMFTTPDTWRQGTQQEMSLVSENWNGKAGVCWAEPAGEYPGLPAGQTAVFKMQIYSRGALRGTGTARVKFADGTMAEIPNVELPQQGVGMGRDAALIGTGIIFAGFIIIHEYRRRRRGATPAPVDED
ncbi:MAG: hypothetical protein HY718_08515 [Planctomycetes bacterium]|nr:hypothetical protein [Planctomycetota bacterium]